MLKPWFSLVVSSLSQSKDIVFDRGWLDEIELEVLAVRLWQVQVHRLKARWKQMQRVPVRQSTCLVTTSQKCGQWKQSMRNVRNWRMYYRLDYHRVSLRETELSLKQVFWRNGTNVQQIVWCVETCWLDVWCHVKCAKTGLDWSLERASGKGIFCW